MKKYTCIFVGKSDLQKYNSDDTLSNSSVKLPECTEDYDKDIPPSPKVRKCKPGQKIKTSVTSQTSVLKTNTPIDDGNETDNSEVFIPCSGMVSGTKNYRLLDY